MGVAIALVVLIAASLLFHFVSPWYFTELASDWGTIDTTVAITFWVTGFVFVVVNLFMAWAIWRYRYRRDARAAYEPENKRLEWWLLGITTVGVAAMLAPGLFVWAKFVDVPKDAMVVEALGQQWNWKFRFPGPDGRLGLVDTQYVTPQNPFGLAPNDVNGQDDIIVDNGVVHLPLGKPIKLLLRSHDVLHNFSVAQIRVKMDLVPGMVTHMWFTPTRAGEYDLLCEELCGVAHFAMRGKMVIQTEAEFDKWLASQNSFAATIKRSSGTASAGQPMYAMCAACHGAQGEGNADLHAPKLAGLGDWYVARQLHLYKSGARGTHEKDVYGKMMAPMAAALPDDAAIANVAAYIATLPDQPVSGTVQGDAKRGKQRYVSCAGCHGAQGQGSFGTGAPRLKGMSDWYLVTQLRNFKNGARGSTPHDLHGVQMALMSGVLLDERAINDVVAYIKTF